MRYFQSSSCLFIFRRESICHPQLWMALGWTLLHIGDHHNHHLLCFANVLRDTVFIKLIRLSLLGWPRSLATSKLSPAPLSASSPHMPGACCREFIMIKFHPKQSELIYPSITIISHQVQAPHCLFCAGRPLPPWSCSRYTGLLSFIWFVDFAEIVFFFREEST